MPDQAYDLRRLATHCERVESPRSGKRSLLLVVAGGKGGVGTTTVALNLAAALAQSGKRAIFIDADPQGGDAGILCAIEEQNTLADVLAGRRTWDEAACLGPNGERIVVGEKNWSGGDNPTAADLLLERLEHQNIADCVVVDAGNARGGLVARLCREADLVLLVTTSDAASVVGTFAAVKSLVFASRQARLCLLVNMATAAQAAETAYFRLAHTCQRMLGIELRSAGHLTMATSQGKDSRVATIGLNLQPSLVDTVREVSALDAVLK